MIAKSDCTKTRNYAKKAGMKFTISKMSVRVSKKILNIVQYIARAGVINIIDERNYLEEKYTKISNLRDFKLSILL